MKEFKSKGISLEGIVGENPAKEKKAAGKAYNQSIAITEDLVWGTEVIRVRSPLQGSQNGT